MRAAVTLLLLVALPIAQAHPALESRLAKLDAWLAEAPEEPSLYLLRGEALSRHGDIDLAEKDFKTALVLGSPGAAHLSLARHYLRHSAPREALLHGDRHLAVGGQHAEIHRLRALALSALNRPKQALDAWRVFFDSVNDVHPGDYVSAASLLAADDRTAADALLVDAVGRVGNATSLVRMGTDLAVESGDYQAAIAWWKRLAPAMSENPAWQLELTLLYIQNGETNAARESLDVANTLMENQRKTKAVRELAARWQALATLLNEPG